MGLRRYLKTSNSTRHQSYNSQLLHHDLPTLSPSCIAFATNTIAPSSRLQHIHLQIRRSQLIDEVSIRTIFVSYTTLHYPSCRLTHFPWRETFREQEGKHIGAFIDTGGDTTERHQLSKEQDGSGRNGGLGVSILVMGYSQIKDEE
jgi:hypothetical protein